MYATLGCLAVIAAAWRDNVWIALAAILAVGAWSLTLWPSVFELFLHHPVGDLFTGMSPDRPYVEEAREALGLTIGVVAMIHLWLAARSAAIDAAAQTN